MINPGASSNMQDFESKRRQLFDCLDNAGKDLKGTILDQTNNDKRIRHLLKRPISEDLDISKFRGKESIFKKPELPISKCLKPRVTPDYQVNPHKWKKYSLSDVDISDQTNKAAAYAFLKEIEIKKDQEGEDMDAADPNAKPVFNKTVALKRSLSIDNALETDDLEKPKLKGAKLVMPEYVVGQKVKKEKKKPTESRSIGAGKQLKLTHLLDEEEGDE